MQRPKTLHPLYVSRTTRPVTQTADVEVNSASENEGVYPLPEAAGIHRRPAPTKIAPAKAYRII